jgi:hypothetical protein
MRLVQLLDRPFSSPALVLVGAVQDACAFLYEIRTIIRTAALLYENRHYYSNRSFIIRKLALLFEPQLYYTKTGTIIRTVALLYENWHYYSNRRFFIRNPALLFEPRLFCVSD